MYQEYDIPFNLERENIYLSVEKEGDYFVYRRQCIEEKVEKILAAGEGKIIVNPVEPLTRPKELSPYFLFSFQRKVMLGPKANKSLYLKFPIEIAFPQRVVWYGDNSKPAPLLEAGVADPEAT